MDTGFIVLLCRRDLKVVEVVGTVNLRSRQPLGGRSGDHRFDISAS
jgi:hypothetical protein